MRQLAPTQIAEALPPEKFLETNQQRLIRGGIACMHDIPTVQQYVAYENQHERRRWVLRMLAKRAAALRELEIEPETED
jgi:cell division FtsZ-interacting protein ZapD